MPAAWVRVKRRVLCAQAGLPSMEECLHRAESMQHHTDAASVKTCVGLYLLSAEPERGVRLGLQYVKGRSPAICIATFYDCAFLICFTILMRVPRSASRFRCGSLICFTI